VILSRVLAIFVAFLQKVNAIEVMNALIDMKFQILIQIENKIIWRDIMGKMINNLKK